MVLSPFPGFLDAGSYADIRVIATDDGVPVAMDRVFADVDDLNRNAVLPAIAGRIGGRSGYAPVAHRQRSRYGQHAFSATNLPAFGTLTDNGDGSANLQFLPDTMHLAHIRTSRLP
ncbi:MAG: hypothetical protein R3C26_20575 [Calditrichia bacterium]